MKKYQLVEEHQLVLMIPGVKDSINKLQKKEGKIEDIVNTALHMIAELKNRDLTEEEIKELKEILIDPRVEGDDLYTEIEEREVFKEVFKEEGDYNFKSREN